MHSVQMDGALHLLTVATAGANFGQDVTGIVDRLLGEQLSDGGWNCETVDGSTQSSFDTTICLLEALLQHGRAGGGTPEVTATRLRGRVRSVSLVLMLSASSESGANGKPTDWPQRDVTFLTTRNVLYAG
jgi:hypothetical protein